MANSLNALKTATGATTASLAACAGTTSGPIKMSDFKIASVSGLQCPQNMPPGEVLEAQLTFTTAGSRFFSRIGNRPSNFNWVTSDPSFLFVNTSYGYTCDIESVDPGSAYLRGKLVDGYNVGATNYNTQFSQLVNIIEK